MRIKLIIEAYKELWEESKMRFILTILPGVMSLAAIIIIILK